MMEKVSERERDLPRSIIEKLSRLASEDTKTLSLSIGEPDFSLAKPLVKDLKKIVRRYKTNHISHYTSGQGIPALREALADKLKKDNKISLDPEQILVTAGSQPTFFS